MEEWDRTTRCLVRCGTFRKYMRGWERLTSANKCTKKQKYMLFHDTSTFGVVSSAHTRAQSARGQTCRPAPSHADRPSRSPHG